MFTVFSWFLIIITEYFYAAHSWGYSQGCCTIMIVSVLLISSKNMSRFILKAVDTVSLILETRKACVFYEICTCMCGSMCQVILHKLKSIRGTRWCQVSKFSFSFSMQVVLQGILFKPKLFFNFLTFFFFLICEIDTLSNCFK